MNSTKRIKSAYIYILLIGISILQLAASHPKESDSNQFLEYLFAAYTISWLCFFIYLFFISKKQKELENELELLSKELEKQKKN
jgi:CcmD family protein